MAGQPAVLGELGIGVLVCNAGCWMGMPFFLVVMHLGDAAPTLAAAWSAGTPVAEAARDALAGGTLGTGGERVVGILEGPRGSHFLLIAVSLWIFANLGVLLLLFMAGLQSSVRTMLGVGPRALAVAAVGVSVPFVLGVAAGRWLLPELSPIVHVFLGAALSATSVGITARVFQDLGRLEARAAQTVLGAAVVDDVLGLIVLAVVAGLAGGERVGPGAVLGLAAASVGFFGAVLLLGERLVRLVAPTMARLDRHRCRLLFPLVLAFGMAWAASAIGLATIVGAFAAGLILNEADLQRHAPGLEMRELFGPLESLFAPVFFVLIGMQVNLASLLEPGVLALTAGLTGVAVAGKLAAGLVARAGDRLLVGIGLVPRGEVGLVFAMVGRELGVLDGGLFAAVVLTVMITTLVAPVGLRWVVGRA